MEIMNPRVELCKEIEFIYNVMDAEWQQPFLDIYTFKVVYNTRVECTTHDNYSYTRYLHTYSLDNV
jgi:hypothetical protein